MSDNTLPTRPAKWAGKERRSFTERRQWSGMERRAWDGIERRVEQHQYGKTLASFMNAALYATVAVMLVVAIASDLMSIQAIKHEATIERASDAEFAAVFRRMETQMGLITEACEK